MSKNHGIPEDLLKPFRLGKVVPFIGSGLSAAVGYPVWQKLLVTIGKHLLTGEMLSFYNQLDPLQMGQYLYDHGKKAEVVRLIHDQLPSFTGTSEIHEILASLPSKTIITTNWDKLIEKHFETVNKHARVVKNDNDIALVSDKTMIMKIHGDIESAESMVFAEEDYYDFITQRPLIQRYFQVIMATSTILFIGYSFNDVNLKLLFHEIKNTLGKFHTKPFIYIPNADETVMNYFEKRGLIPLTTSGETMTDATLGFLRNLKAEVSLNATEKLDRFRIMDRENSGILKKGICTMLRNMSNLGPLATPETVTDLKLFGSPDVTNAEVMCAKTWRNILDSDTCRAKLIVCLDPGWISSHYNSQYSLERLQTLKQNLLKYREKVEVVDLNNPAFVNTDIYDREVCLESQKYGADQDFYHHLVVHHSPEEVDDKILRFDTLFDDIKKQNELASGNTDGNSRVQFDYIMNRIDQVMLACEARKPVKPNHLVGVCWAFTTECNMECPICFSIKDNHSIVDMNCRKEVIDALHRSGVRKICFSGGEPLLKKDELLHCIIYAKGRGMKTSLCTNGLLLDEEFCRQVSGFLDELTLPLEGPDAVTHAANRGDGSHFRTVLDNLRHAQKNGIKTDISTVMTAANRHAMPELLKLIRTLSVAKWKVFQFYPLENAVTNEGKFSLSKEQFLETKEKLNRERGTVEIDFRNDSPESMRSYLNLSPSGEIILVDNDAYVNLGNLANQSDLTGLLADHSFNFTGHKERHWRD